MRIHGQWYRSVSQKTNIEPVRIVDQKYTGVICAAGLIISCGIAVVEFIDGWLNFQDYWVFVGTEAMLEQLFVFKFGAESWKLDYAIDKITSLFFSSFIAIACTKCYCSPSLALDWFWQSIRVPRYIRCHCIRRLIRSREHALLPPTNGIRSIGKRCKLSS